MKMTTTPRILGGFIAGGTEYTKNTPPLPAPSLRLDGSRKPGGKLKSVLAMILLTQLCASNAYSQRYKVWVAKLAADPLVVTNKGGFTEVLIHGSAGEYSEGVGFNGGGYYSFYLEDFTSPTDVTNAVNEANSFIAWGKGFQFLSGADAPRPSWAKPSSSYSFDGYTWVGFANLDRSYSNHQKAKLRKELRKLMKALKRTKSTAGRAKLRSKINKLKRKIRILR